MRIAQTVYTKPHPSVNWLAVAYKLAARPFALSVAVPLNGSIQVATIQNTAPDVTNAGPIYIWRVDVFLENNSAAAKVLMEIRRLNAGGTVAATGNPALNPTGVITGGAGARPAGLSFLCLPTIPGTEIAGDVFGSREFNLGITGAASVASPPPEPTRVNLWDATGGVVAPLHMRANQKDGYAIVFDGNAATTILCTVNILFSYKTNITAVV
jgi:hypothetical protein